MKIWKLNLETYALVQVIKFDVYKNCITFKAENWKEADKIAKSIIFGKEKQITPPKEIVKIIEEIVNG